MKLVIFLHKLFFLLICLLLIPTVTKGQRIIYQEGFDNIDNGALANKKNADEKLYYAESGLGYSTLSDRGKNSDFVIRKIDISNGIALLNFWHKQSISSGIGTGINVYYKQDSIGTWKLLANFNKSENDWKQETLFLPENSSKYYIKFEGLGKVNDNILLDNIQVNFYKNATATALGNNVFIDSAFNVSSSFVKIEVAENQISGLPAMNNTILTPSVPVQCPSDGTLENEPDCYSNYRDFTNAGCDTIPNNFTELSACNGVICGKSGSFIFNGSVRRDIDWYKLNSTGSSSLSLKVVADFNVRVYVINVIGDCAGIWLYPGYDLSTNAGDTAIINIPILSYSSNLYFWIAPNINQNVPCGSNYIMIYKTVPVVTLPNPVTSGNQVCAPTELNPIAGVPDYQFYWQGNSCGTSLANPTNAAFPAITSGTYYLRGMYEPLGCWTSCSSITVSSPPTLSVNITPGSVCQGDHSVLAVNGASNYTWMPGNLNGNQVSVTPQSSTIYTVTGSSSGCTSSTTASLTVYTKYNFIQNQAICLGSSYNWRGQDYSTAGSYTSNYLTRLGCDSIYTLELTVIPPLRTFNVKVFLEGLCNSNGNMNQAQNLFGSQYGVGVAEKVTVELHDVNPPYNIVYQKLNTDLFTNGMLLIPDLPCTYSGSYYIVIKKINTIETWSSSPISFNSSSQISFDFSNSASQAYGNNLKPIGNIFAIWSGDVTNDGIVDGSDISIVDNDSRNILTGYNIEDLNGDGVVDGSDLAIVDNNSKAVIHVIKP